MKLSELSRRPVSFPKDWTRTKIEDIGTLKSGSTPDRNKVDVYFRSGTIPWVKTLDLNNGLLINTQEKITERALAETSCSIIPKGSVLVAMYGGFNQIGRTGLLSIDAAINQALTAITITNGELEPAYLLDWLNTFVGAWRRFAASSRKDPNITRQDVGAFPLAYPRLEEQRKICGIASLWGIAIEQTEKLITAKAKRKRGLMQQLLTGKKRFQEFIDYEWKPVHLGDVFHERCETLADYIRKLRDAEQEQGKAPGKVSLELLSITAKEGVIHRDALDKRDTSSADKSKYLRICPGDIGYNTMRMWQGVSGLSELEGIISPAYTVCTPTSEIDGKFARHLFKFLPMVHLFWRYSQGLVDDTLSLKFHHFAQIKALLPPIAEQQRIAAVLDNCDKELDLLERQLDALKRQKRGLMHKLLTGQIRVKVDDVEAAVVEAG